MDDEEISLPDGLITVRVERPLRMMVETPAIAPDPLVGEKRASAVPAYSSPLAFDWRDEPLGSAA